jgi:uncharacterized protein YkwD
MRRTSVLAVLACAAVFLVPASPAQANPAHAVVAKVNAYRAANGLPPLRLSRSLSRSSYAYAQHLMRADRFGHAAHIRASSRFRMLGENLAFSWGRRKSARIPVRGWSRSAPHRAVLLNRKFRYVGVGRVSGRFGSRRATIWVLHAGR